MATQQASRRLQAIRLRKAQNLIEATYNDHTWGMKWMERQQLAKLIDDLEYQAKAITATGAQQA